MQRGANSIHRKAAREFPLGNAAGRLDEDAGLHRGTYGVQVLIAGRQKHWRDDMHAQVRRAGFSATTVDSAIDALRFLALGLPADALLTDIDLQGKLGCCKLAREGRAMRPNLAIIFARDLSTDEAALAPDNAMILPAGARLDGVARLVRDALVVRTG